MGDNCRIDIAITDTRLIRLICSILNIGTDYNGFTFYEYQGIFASFGVAHFGQQLNHLT